MFDALPSFGRAALALAASPIDALADAATLGGALVDRSEPYTVTRARQVMDNIDRAVSPRHTQRGGF